MFHALKELLEPKLIRLWRLKEYSTSDFYADLIAGLVVAIVALPLAMAIAIASNLPPERGLFTAIVAGFIISAHGGSRYQIGGPTAAFIVTVAMVAMKHGYEGLVLATIMAGIILMIMAFIRAGELIKFIPYPVVVGFTSGIALLIAFSQIRVYENEDDPDAIDRKTVPKDVEVYEINGPLFFGVAEKLIDTLSLFEHPPKVFILRMRHVPLIDAAGLHALEVLYERLREQHTFFVLSGVSVEVKSHITETGLNKLIGDENIVDHINKAIKRATKVLNADQERNKGEILSNN